MKLRSSNLANGSSMAILTAWVKKFPWKGRGLSHVTLLKIKTPFNISVMHEATLFKFGRCVDYGKCHARGKFQKRAWSVSRDRFCQFKPPWIFLEWMKLRSLNLASGSTTASPTLRVKNSLPKGTWFGSLNHFWGEATLFKFRRCIDNGKCLWQVPYQRLKISPKTGVVSVTWLLFKF